MKPRSRPRQKPVEKMTRGERVCAFIETHCRVPEGSKVGQPIVLEGFQRQFILSIYDNPAGTSRAILSIARKNGKSALIAAIVLAHVVGPEAVQNTQIISGARSRDQAALVFKLAAKMVSLSPELRDITRIIPSSKSILGLRKNVEYIAISAEAKTAHGKSPILAVLDELGQVRGPTDDFVDAIETSQGAHDAPLLIAISTQAAQDTDMLSLWIDDALESKDPKIVCHVYAAPADCDLLDEEAWRASNPALAKFRSLEDMRNLAQKALRMPAFENTFRNLNLNQRVEVKSPFVSKEVWQACARDPAPLARQKVWGGLDLSAVSDLTALVLVSDEWDVWPTFWLPHDGLKEKSREARTPYDVWAQQGHLLTTPGPTVQYQHVAAYLRGVFQRYDVQAIAFDRYNMKFLRPWLVKAGFSERELERFVDFGQGFVSMSPALRALESALLEGRLKHGGHPVLQMCAANAKVVQDPAGNRKFVKGKALGRIDGMVSLAMAAGVMPEHHEEKPKDYALMFF